MDEEEKRARWLALQAENLQRFGNLIEAIGELDKESLSDRDERQFSKAATSQARAMRAKIQTAQTVPTDDELYDQFYASEERILEETNRALTIMKQILERVRRRKRKKG